MILSLNEVDALCRKATRGAGFCWGLAEEAGHACAWLGARGLPGPRTLCNCLSDVDNRDVTSLTPQLDKAEMHWRAVDGDLCPIVAGPALADRVAMLIGGRAIEFAATAYPLLLIPQLAFAAQRFNANLQVAWEGVEAYCDDKGDVYLINDCELDASRAHNVRFAVSHDRSTEVSRLPSSFSAVVDDAVYRQLDTFAYRTYAPESDASRMSGAGAGLTDND